MRTLRVEARLRRLERALRKARPCTTCAHWPVLVEYEDDWRTAGSPPDAPPLNTEPPDVQPPEAQPPDGSHPDGRHSGAPPAPLLPPHCPACGRAPRRVAVRYVDDWRECRRAAAAESVWFPE